MIRLSKSFNTFEEVLDELTAVGYSDPVIGNMNDVEYVKEMYSSYAEMLDVVLGRVKSDKPGYMNPRFPNGINLSVNSFGFRYMIDNRGIGISPRLNKKSQSVTFTLTFSFNREEFLLESDPVYTIINSSGTYDKTSN